MYQAADSAAEALPHHDSAFADAAPATLYHDVACPWSRAARIVMGEKRTAHLLAALTAEDQAAGLASPHFIDLCGTQITDGDILLEYLDDAGEGSSLLGESAAARAEARRLVRLFGITMHQTVTVPLYHEKVEKPLARRAGYEFEPVNSRVVREATGELKAYALFIGELFAGRKWLAGDHFSLADAVAAAQISLLDLMNVVPWNELSAESPDFRTWYACVKSRPAFRLLADDEIQGLKRPRHYADPDF